MPETIDKITVRYEVWNGDATPHFLLPLPKIGIMEVLSVTFFDGKWTVMSNEPGAPPEWIGRDEYRQIAILKYLQARLGHYEGEKVDRQND